MLVLSRRPGETLRLGDHGHITITITITILGVKGNQVRIGIDAPRDMPVHRQEIFELVQADKEGGHVVAGAAVQAWAGKSA